MEVRKEDQRDQDEKVVEIEIERLRDFKNHPFKVQADSQMKELQESIKKYGILNPLIVRPRPEGFYEIISGHRTKYAAQQLKYTKVLRRRHRRVVNISRNQDGIRVLAFCKRHNLRQCLALLCREIVVMQLFSYMKIRQMKQFQIVSSPLSFC